VGEAGSCGDQLEGLEEKGNSTEWDCQEMSNVVEWRRRSKLRISSSKQLVIALLSNVAES